MKKCNIDRSHYLFDNQALVSLIVPLIIEQLLTVLVGMADSIMVANVGEAAVSGVSLVDQIMVLLINIFAALATGGAVVAGQYLGQKNKEQACKSTTQLMWSMGFISLVITAFVYACKYWVLHGVFGQIEADVMHHADVYLLIVTASIPFIALYNGGAAVFRAMGNSEVSMKVSLLMNAINVSGNAILIYGFHCGTEGVAIPTLVSRFVAAFIIIKLLLKDKWSLHLERTFRFNPDWSMIRKILSVGIPNGLENSMFQLGKILLLSLISTFGTASIAANAVSNSLAYFEILPGMALGLATVTVISRCVGAGDYPQAEYFAKRLLKFTYTCMWITCIVMMLLLPFMLKIYNLSPETSGYATQIMILHSIMAIIFWPAAFALPNVFRAANDVRFTMVVGVTSMWLFRIACAFIFGKYMGFGVFGAWIAMVLDWVVRAIFYVIHYRCGKWKEKSL